MDENPNFEAFSRLCAEANLCEISVIAKGLNHNVNVAGYLLTIEHCIINLDDERVVIGTHILECSGCYVFQKEHEFAICYGENVALDRAIDCHVYSFISADLSKREMDFRSWIDRRQFRT
ncbi:MAG: hypothetical protein COU07_00690 [Candidatus Harrisonbacteria bacterium CG10_big_fil_rev_8_21_14_0_10_40_38]|uniref:Uncharacterized protein n=1 Tax=Candidatus Harrisonbacteria bacterium CG10_big_fil_rev_8_21_14_0_10_40_38 TaxID=1974583 RepID=A0A2H0USL8_9BACT|nr:MAG: hypothetical protein COU07_00690 [Candidatus Harrisonbacteria bacterium CG10_big_fil_rev_8_21_14_0_10_40_38]